MRFFAFAFTITLFLLPLAAKAEEPAFFFPDARYDRSQPTLIEVVGHEPGEKLTKPAQAIHYLEALAQANPDRMKVVEYATSWEGRPLVYAIITSAENMARLDDIQTAIQTLSDPRSVTQAKAEELMADLPATVWLSYAVHGNEISSTDAALLTAYHLLASENDDRVEDILRETIVFIDPMQNPDGRARFIHTMEQALGLEAIADRQAAEHDEPWPGGRTNHYLFDLNRDWFILSQPETRGKVSALMDWWPLLFVDAHEMGGDSSYYFAPSAQPYNLHQPDSLRAAKTLIGQNTARWFDRLGIDYFTREVFDSFYPGYGDTWPSYFGSLSQTYEQASSRGLVWRKRDGRTLTYADGVRNHFIASLSAAEVAADKRADFWQANFNFRRTAIEEGRRDGVRTFVLPAQANQSGADHLARILAFQGVEVDRAEDGFTLCNTRYEVGSYLIDTAQPLKRLVRVLMDKDVPIDAEFMAEQERRRAKGLSAQIYDITAWSLPLMFGVEADSCGRTASVDTNRVTRDEAPSAQIDNLTPDVAYLVPWGEGDAASLLAHALRQGIEVMATDLAFTHEGTRYPRGTLIIKPDANGPGLAATMRDLAAKTGADVIGVDSSWVTDGPNFGSNNVSVVPAPKIAIAWDEPANPYSAGNLRYVIERRLGYPIAAIRTDRLASADLRSYDVVILADSFGSYGSVRGLADKLKDFTAQGGTILGVDGGAAFLAHPDVDLIAARREYAHREEEAPKPEDGARVPGTLITDPQDYDAAILPGKTAPDRLPGAILKALVDPDHWSTAGLGAHIHTLVRGSDIYTPITLDKGVNAIRFAGSDDLVAAGYVWEETRAQMAHKPLMIVQNAGRGQVIAITQDIATRAYQPGLDLLIANAIFFGPSHSARVR